MADVEQKKRKDTQRKREGRIKKLKTAVGEDKIETQILLTLAKVCNYVSILERVKILSYIRF